MIYNEKTMTHPQYIDDLEEDVLRLEMENYHLLQKVQRHEFELYKFENIQRLTKTGTWELNHLTYQLIFSKGLSTLLCHKSACMGDYSWGDFLDRLCLRQDDSDDKSIRDKLIDNVIQKGQNLDIEHAFLRCDGHIIYVRHNCKTFYNAIGQPSITVGVIRDITLEYQQSMVLLKLSSTDELTQLYNRRRINEVIADQYNLFDRYQKVSSYIMLDIDNFKAINDSFGHQVGDQVLTEVAKLIKDNIRSVDYAGRWGGEEFLIICVNTKLESAVSLAEKLRQAFVHLTIYQGANVSASFGVGELRGCDSIDALIKRIDDALYQAKENGRNQVCIA